jgi:hypothetical protein
VETAFGTGFGHSNFTLPAMETDRHPTANQGRSPDPLGHGPAGAALVSNTFGAKCQPIRCLVRSYDQRFVSAPSQRATCPHRRIRFPSTMSGVHESRANYHATFARFATLLPHWLARW